MNNFAKFFLIVSIILFLFVSPVGTQTQVPQPPDNLKLLSVSQFKLTITWTYPAKDILFFKVERGVEASIFFFIASVAPTVREYRDEDVVFSSKAQYFYRVSACDPSGCSAPSSVLVVNYITYLSFNNVNEQPPTSPASESEDKILTYKYSEGFQRLKWGMSIEKAKTLLKKKCIERSSGDFATLYFAGVMGKYPYKAELWFYKNHLCTASFYLHPPGTGPKWKNQTWIAAYTGIANLVAHKYGYSSASTECGSYVDMASEDGCFAAWETEETQIFLTLHCKYSQEERMRVADLELTYLSEDIYAIAETVIPKKVKKAPTSPYPEPAPDYYAP